MDTPQLIKQLHDVNLKEPDKQFKAAIALGDSAAGNREIVDELIKALGQQHQALTRAHAAEALGKAADSHAIPALISALADDYQLVRSYAARALGKIKDPAAIKAINPLIEILGKDKFFGARAEAAEALGKLCELCKTDDSLVAKGAATTALEVYREAEKKRLLGNQEEGRSRRVLAEINISLEKLGQILNEIEKALREGKHDYALSLAKKGRDEIERMGALTKSNRMGDLTKR